MRDHAALVGGIFRGRADAAFTQEQLLERVNAAGKPVVLVLTNGSALAVNWANQHVAAILV